MPIALHTPGRAAQPRQGVGARLVRRLGGAVRSAIVSGITLAGALRRPAASRTSRDHAGAQDRQAPPPRRVPLPRRPSAALPAPLPLPPWLAPLRARRRRPACLSQGDVPFTPQAFPQLSPQACAVLNTPLKDCDPKTLELLVSTFTQYVNQVMSPEAGIADPQAVLPNLWHRISTALADTEADASPPATPGPVPATPADETPEPPVAPPHPPAPPTGPAMPSAKAGVPPSDAKIIAVAPDTTPDIAAPSAPVGHASRPLSNPDRSFRYNTQSFAPRRRRSLLYCRALFPRALRDALQCQPPWRLCYAACTGPP